MNTSSITPGKLLICLLIALSLVSFVMVPYHVQAIEDFPVGYEETNPDFYIYIQDKITLPVGFEFNRLREKATIHDTQALIASVMEWGYDLWIEKTRSSWSSFWMKLKRYFWNLDANYSVMRQLSTEENYQFLLMSRRWGIKPELFAGNLNTVVSGWQVLEFECIALSKMLSISGIPRTLLDEVDNLINEINSLSSERETVGGDPEMAFARTRITNENHWAFYLAALQHGLIPERLVNPISLIDRTDQVNLITQPISKLDVLEFAYQSMGYIEQFTDDITGFSNAREIFNENLQEHVSIVYNLGLDRVK
ncbi:MAG TPA: hypothetical protein PLP35_06400 [Caldisericia bacterium]|nr:hypothetical protein [Caldisericia bacterium]